MNVGRRTFVKALLGAGAVAAAAPREAVAEARAAPPGAVGMLYDTTRCIGCKTCVVACRQANGLGPDEGASGQGIYDAPLDLDSGTKNVIKLYEEGGERSYMKAQCMHCIDPACVGACMLGALKKREWGVVTWDGTKCVGCRYCQMACPFSIPKFEWHSLNPRIVKCELCLHRLLKGGQPACCEVCPREAVVFGKRDELLAEAKRRLAAHPDRYVNQVYGEHDGGGTQVLYLSHVPFEKLGLPDLGDESPAARARTIQHVMFGGVLVPLAVLLAGSAYVHARRRQKDEAAGRTPAGDEEEAS
jgi:Fe-S-cluster-containing dehydrogenase component